MESICIMLIKIFYIKFFILNFVKIPIMCVGMVVVFFPFFVVLWWNDLQYIEKVSYLCKITRNAKSIIQANFSDIISSYQCVNYTYLCINILPDNIND